MPSRTISSNTPFYSDNLSILHEHIAGESVDLVHLARGCCLPLGTSQCHKTVTL